MIEEFDKRIIEPPYHLKWFNHICNFNDSISYDGKINYEGFDDLNKLYLYIYAKNQSDLLASKKKILKKFDWTNYKLQKLIKKSNGLIKVESSINEDTGLLSGKGYYFDEEKYKNIS